MAPTCTNISHQILTSWSTISHNKATSTLAWTSNAGGYTTTPITTATNGSQATINVTLPVQHNGPPAFNKYVNASDMLEEFIRYAGGLGLKTRDIKELPIDLFIKWLVIRACEEDHEEPTIKLSLPTSKQQPRCIRCKRFMEYNSDIPFDRPECAVALMTERRELLTLMRAA